MTPTRRRIPPVVQCLGGGRSPQGFCFACWWCAISLFVSLSLSHSIANSLFKWKMLITATNHTHTHTQVKPLVESNINWGILKKKKKNHIWPPDNIFPKAGPNDEYNCRNLFLCLKKNKLYYRLETKCQETQPPKGPPLSLWTLNRMS